MSHKWSIYLLEKALTIMHPTHFFIYVVCLQKGMFAQKKTIIDLNAYTAPVSGCVLFFLVKSNTGWCMNTFQLVNLFLNFYHSEYLLTFNDEIYPVTVL